MFECNVCQKTYATQNSLTRHAHNHGPSKRHCCTICDVDFRRRDLLARHLKIHQTPDPSNGKGRQRCHTACQSCRETRTKCDSKLPCTPCAQAQRQCLYSHDRRRVSRLSLTASSSNVGDLDTAPKHDSCMSDPSSSGIVSADVASPRESPFEESSVTLSTVGKPVNSNDTVMNIEDEEIGNILASMHTAPLEDYPIPFEYWPAPIGWPWTHEDMFLQDGPSIQLNQSSDSTHSMNLLPASNFDLDGLSTDNMATSNATCTDDSLHPLTKASLTEVVTTIVAESMQLPAEVSQRAQYWLSASCRLQESLRQSCIDDNIPDKITSLSVFIDIFLKHFQPLWPLLWQPGLGYDELHPLLYLTLTSIGALYAGAAWAKYGSLMHETIRSTLLLLPPPHNEQTEEEALDLGRAMLLTQVAALYFEQQQAFSAAQRLGALLSSHAQRMGLFNLRKHKRNSTPIDILSMNGATADRWLKQWVLLEGRKRLAFGFMRAEIFMSVLLNSKPLVSYEEVDLELPCAEHIWITKRKSAREYIMAIGQDRSLCHGMIFSDVVRIALDKDEVLPTLLPQEHELLLYGLQQSVWRFCHDPEMLERLVGNEREVSFRLSPSTDTTEGDFSPIDFACGQSERDHLDYSTRKMRDLFRERDSTIRALRKWKDMFANSQISSQHGHNRTIYLGGFLLFHLSFVRLHAPIEMIQQIAYHHHGDSETTEELVEGVSQWSRRQDADIAVKHACAIWTLIEKETARERSKQARYNILALIGLHQAATVIWAVAGMSEQSTQTLELSGSRDTQHHTGTTLCRANTRTLLIMFADLFPKITLTWGLESSFSKMVLRLANSPFPSL